MPVDLTKISDISAGIRAEVTPLQSFARGINTMIGRCAEFIGAALLVIEFGILLTGVIARYVFHSPLTWSDELAGILFLWLSMVGIVLALYRHGHMSLEVVQLWLPESVRSKLQAIAMCVVALVAGSLIGPAFEHIHELDFMKTPVLQIPEPFRLAAPLFGFVMVVIVAILQLLIQSSWRDLLWGVGISVAGLACVWALGPLLHQIGNFNLLFFFVFLVMGCVMIGVPIGFAFGAGTVLYLSTVSDISLTVLVGTTEEHMSSVLLLSAPLFVLLGLVMQFTGLAEAMIRFFVTIFGGVRGGLQYVLLGAMYVVSGISGSKAADMAAVAPVLIPEMQKRGVKDRDLLSLLASSGAMAETIPPSIVLIIVGSVTGLSISALFTAGLLPALIAAFCLAALIWYQARNDERGERSTWGQRGKALVVALPALALPLLIRTFVVEGVATATEVSTIGIVYVLVVGALVYRKFEWRKIYPALVTTASMNGAIMIIIGFASAMAWCLTQSGFSFALIQMVTSLPGGAVTFMIVSIVLFFVLGSLLEGIPALVLFAPLLYPAASTLGINQIHYAMVTLIALGIGLVAPPFGVGYYAASAISGIKADAALTRIWPYLGAVFIALVLVALFPWLSTGFLG
ncbi:tripartite ATP-independent transporter DctM subunit [Neorhizobium galegae]|uniref:TRAP transporter large permease n=1 Tax=Neorhizobium galegae TaxID=399 RepID=UPI002782B7FA|nr:TRAP transporter large permease subunit [Neorhizobium galegae]MDQ0137705.1 tripartite ATP-independent transporter DctM subunit [Neorhizobium galegae]